MTHSCPTGRASDLGRARTVGGEDRRIGGKIGQEGIAGRNVIGRKVRLRDRRIPGRGRGTGASIHQSRRWSGHTPSYHKGDALCAPSGHGQHCLSSRFVRWHVRSEEHTSELQSLMRTSYAVFCLKKKTAKSTLTTKLLH